MYKLNHRGDVSSMKILLYDEGDSFKMIFIVRNLKMIKNWNFLFYDSHAHFYELLIVFHFLRFYSGYQISPYSYFFKNINEFHFRW